MTSPVNAYLILATVASIKEGKAIAQRLLQDRAAACSNLVPGVTSIFRWEGRIEEASEVLMIAKTTGDKLQAAIKLINEVHSYDVPEILAFPIYTGNSEYLNWVREETEPG